MALFSFRDQNLHIQLFLLQYLGNLSKVEKKKKEEERDGRREAFFPLDPLGKGKKGMLMPWQPLPINM